MATVETAIKWKQGHDEHSWTASVGNIYRLRVRPEIGAHGGYNTITYLAEVCNASLSTLAEEGGLVSVEHARQRCAYLTWRHNFDIGDMLLTQV